MGSVMVWEPHLRFRKSGFVLFVGLNPSTAAGVDEKGAYIDDNTIRKERKLVASWGFSDVPEGPPVVLSSCKKHRYVLRRPGLVMCNLFSLRSTKPEGLLETQDNGSDSDNVEYVAQMAHEAELVVCAWGGPYSPRPLRDLVGRQAKRMERRLRIGNRTLYCLATTKDGHPRHPLYLRDDSLLKEWP